MDSNETSEELAKKQKRKLSVKMADNKRRCSGKTRLTRLSEEVRSDLESRAKLRGWKGKSRKRGADEMTFNEMLLALLQEHEQLCNVLNSSSGLTVSTPRIPLDFTQEFAMGRSTNDGDAKEALQRRALEDTILESAKRFLNLYISGRHLELIQSCMTPSTVFTLTCNVPTSVAGVWRGTTAVVSLMTQAWPSFVQVKNLEFSNFFVRNSEVYCDATGYGCLVRDGMNVCFEGTMLKGRITNDMLESLHLVLVVTPMLKLPAGASGAGNVIQPPTAESLARVIPIMGTMEDAPESPYSNQPLDPAYRIPPPRHYHHHNNNHNQQQHQQQNQHGRLPQQHQSVSPRPSPTPSSSHSHPQSQSRSPCAFSSSTCERDSRAASDGCESPGADGSFGADGVLLGGPGSVTPPPVAPLSVSRSASYPSTLPYTQRQSSTTLPYNIPMHDPVFPSASVHLGTPPSPPRTSSPASCSGSAPYVARTASAPPSTGAPRMPSGRVCSPSSCSSSPNTPKTRQVGPSALSPLSEGMPFSHNLGTDASSCENGGHASTSMPSRGFIGSSTLCSPNSQSPPSEAFSRLLGPIVPHTTSSHPVGSSSAEGLLASSVSSYSVSPYTSSHGAPPSSTPIVPSISTSTPSKQGSPSTSLPVSAASNSMIGESLEIHQQYSHQQHQPQHRCQQNQQYHRHQHQHHKMHQQATFPATTSMHSPTGHNHHSHSHDYSPSRYPVEAVGATTTRHLAGHPGFGSVGSRDATCGGSRGPSSVGVTGQVSSSTAHRIGPEAVSMKDSVADRMIMEADCDTGSGKDISDSSNGSGSGDGYGSAPDGSRTAFGDGYCGNDGGTDRRTPAEQPATVGFGMSTDLLQCPTPGELDVGVLSWTSDSTAQTPSSAYGYGSTHTSAASLQQQQQQQAAQTHQTPPLTPMYEDIYYPSP